MRDLTTADLTSIKQTTTGALVRHLHIRDGLIRGQYGRSNPLHPDGLLGAQTTTWNAAGDHLKNARLNLDLTPLK